MVPRLCFTKVFSSKDQQVNCYSDSRINAEKSSLIAHKERFYYGNFRRFSYNRYSNNFAEIETFLIIKKSVYSLGRAEPYLSLQNILVMEKGGGTRKPSKLYIMAYLHRRRRTQRPTKPGLESKWL